MAKKHKTKLRTFLEMVQSIRKPIAPPGRSHGDARKEKSRKDCRGKYHDDS